MVETPSLLKSLAVYLQVLGNGISISIGKSFKETGKIIRENEPDLFYHGCSSLVL